MKRRDLLKKGVYGLAGVTLSSTLISTLQSCSSIEKYNPVYFSKTEFSLLSNIVDFFIPKTETPGAVDMKVPQFIDIIISETYNNESKNNFSNKLKLLIKDFKSNNIDLSDYNSMKSKFVNDFNNKTHQEIYNQIRDLTVWGFKTSKEIALNVLNYNPIPGYQLGCIDIDK
jgi:transcription-repair coupling factor (superfamily II helicase)